ncbi:MFS transporter [Kutzneria sp. NPDC051319]|uniref:MFS transporter n=1 Tax=Kutzneria sp. NPDC051319 TaxID=3155047 RepID=UPI0034248CD7
MVSEVTDFYGRRYRVGESDRELLGHSRNWVLAAACVAMLVAGAGQYGFGLIVGGEYWLLAIWVATQAVAVFPLAWLRERLHVRPTLAMIAGAMLTALGDLFAGAWTAVLGGLGAAIVYGACFGVVAKWFPERRTCLGLVSGAFAAGSVLFATPLSIIAVVVITACGFVLREPPPDWWPAKPDPRKWALDKTLNLSLKHNRPAIRRYTPGQLLRCPTSAVMYVLVACAAAAWLFDVAYMAAFVASSGWGYAFAAVAVCVLTLASGVARWATGWAGERFGVGRVVRTALALGALGQLLLIVAGQHQAAVLLVFAALLVGTTAGCCYALLPALVEAHFGDQAGLLNFGLVYSAKAVGGIVGIGLTTTMVATYGYAAGFLLAAGLGVLGALAGGMLRQPGVPRLLVPA